MPATTDADRADALAWLAGRLFWERLLTDLQQRAEDAGEPVAFPSTDEDEAATTPARAA